MSNMYFVYCPIESENLIAYTRKGMPRIAARISGRALSRRSFGSERPAYSTNSSFIAIQHKRGIRQNAGRLAGAHCNTGPASDAGSASDTVGDTDAKLPDRRSKTTVTDRTPGRGQKRDKIFW